MATAQATSNEITLRGSTDIVTEFFGYSINSILYQRGIYPPDTFKRVSKYGLALLVTQDDYLQGYLDQVLKQLEAWLLQGTVQKLVLVITGCETKEVLERWVFNVEADKTVVQAAEAVDQEQKAPNATGADGAAPGGPAPVKQKSKKEIMSEIQAIIRQITASVTFLPLLSEACTFDLLVHTDCEAAVPQTWEESDPRHITDATDVKLRSFTTKIHKVDTCVSYRNDSTDPVLARLAPLVVGDDTSSSLPELGLVLASSSLPTRPRMK
ncbi:Mitotic spindle assembly checkpoint protein MAD2A (Mitotic arrest deficient 2-like protein 1) (MAD2-like protein 1), partial [Durusdinium trenchii]